MNDASSEATETNNQNGSSSDLKATQNTKPSYEMKMNGKTPISPSKITKTPDVKSPIKSNVKNEPLSPRKLIASPQAKADERKPLPKIPKIKRLSSPSKPSPSKLNSVKHETKEDDFDDVPLAKRAKMGSKPVKQEKKPVAKKTKPEPESSDDEPLSSRIKKSKTPTPKDKKSVKKTPTTKKRKMDDSDEDEKPLKNSSKSPAGKGAKDKTKTTKSKQNGKEEVKKSKKKPKPEEPEVWKWWEEEAHPEGVKWLSLEHNGPFFPPDYERLPENIKFYYDGKHMVLSDRAEEVATFYGKMIDHDYTEKEIFNRNFFEDWRKEMTDEERKTIKDLKKCNFKEIDLYFKKISEERKARTKEQKLKGKEENDKITEEYGFCMMDNHKQKVGNFRIEPPGLFRGRGDHPKQGKLKKRVLAREIIINIGKGAKVPAPPPNQKWKAVQHDNKVTWLACWIENIAGNYKYIMLNAATKIKGEKDWQKFETARKLKGLVGDIRHQYEKDLKAKEMRVRQRAVALYFIDKLALRAGHEKEEGESADTVGCCSLRVEHIKLHPEYDGMENVVEFDFLGKDSIRYTNHVEVTKRVYKNIQIFMEDKQDGDDLFDRLTSSLLNKYLSELMEGLTAKVFRTYNASNTLQEQLNKLTNADDNPVEKLLSYNRANRAVAILCNHQRAVPKTFDQQMDRLSEKIIEKKKKIKETKQELKLIKQSKELNEKTGKQIEAKKKQVERLKDQLFKLEVNVTDKEENKQIALGTSKLNYLDPRISIAWCKKNDVPIDKIYNKTQRQKFQWAIDMTEPDFVF